MTRKARIPSPFVWLAHLMAALTMLFVLTPGVAHAVHHYHYESNPFIVNSGAPLWDDMNGYVLWLDTDAMSVITIDFETPTLLTPSNEILGLPFSMSLKTLWVVSAPYGS